MASTRSVEWKLTCPPDEADMHVRQAMTELGLEPEGSPGAIRGKKKGSFRKGMSADVTIDISPTTGEAWLCVVPLAGAATKSCGTSVGPWAMMSSTIVAWLRP